MLKMIKRLKGETKFQTYENYSMAGTLFGTIMFSFGILLASITPKGAPAVIIMLGAVVAFMSTVTFVFILLLKDLLGKE